MAGSKDEDGSPRRRRANGDGTVWQDKNGQWWAALRFAAGARPHKVRAASQKDAERKLAELKRLRDADVQAPTAQTLEAWLNEWLRDIVAPRLKIGTVRFYRQTCENYIVPTLGHVRLSDLKPANVRSMMARLRAKKYDPQTVNHAHTVLRTALEAARKDRRIPYNPAADVDKLKLPRKLPFEPLTPSEAAAILWAVQGHRLEAMYHLAFWGFRIGELLGLRITDLDLGAAIIKVEQGAVLGLDGKMTIDTPKTDNAYRTLPLTPRLVAVLRTRLEILLIERGHAKWQEHGLLFPSEVGTIIAQRNAARQLTDVILPIAGITRPWSWHKFRHTCVSWLADTGASDEVTRAIIGHSDVSVTDRYRHISLDAMRRALERMEAEKLNTTHQASEADERAKKRRIDGGR